MRNIFLLFVILLAISQVSLAKTWWKRRRERRRRRREEKERREKEAKGINTQLPAQTSLNSINEEILKELVLNKIAEDSDLVVNVRFNSKDGLFVLKKFENPENQIKYIELFKQVKNIFNDALPTTHYFDLSSVLKKYDLLDAKASQEVYISWKTVLMTILEKMKMKYNIHRSDIYGLLAIPNENGLEWVYHHSNPADPINLKFSEELTTSLTEFQPYAEILKNNFIRSYMLDLTNNLTTKTEYEKILYSEDKTEGFRGYLLKLSTYPVTVKGFSISLDGKGEISLLIYDKESKKKVIESTKKFDTKNKMKEFFFGLPEIKLKSNHNYLVLFNYKGLASFAYKKSDTNARDVYKGIQIWNVITEKNCNLSDISVSHYAKALEVKMEMNYDNQKRKKK